MAAASEANRWSNRVWAQAGTPTPVQPRLAAEMDQARASFRWNREQTIFGPIDEFLHPGQADSLTGVSYAHYVALYLRWEADYPQAGELAGVAFHHRVQLTDLRRTRRKSLEKTGRDIRICR